MELPESDKEAQGCISVATPTLHMRSPELGPQHWRKKKLGFKGTGREKEEEKEKMTAKKTKYKGTYKIFISFLISFQKAVMWQVEWQFILC